MPQFVHLPLLLKPIGQGKLSKRDADEQGFPIFPIAWNDPATHTYTEGFREKGYLPEALRNFLALLGWSPKGNQEIFSLAELIDAFSLEGIGKSGVKFDIQKANWFNHHYLAAQPPQVWSDYLVKALTERHILYNPAQVEKVCELVKERAVVLNDLWKEGQIFFEPPATYDPAAVEKRWTYETVNTLAAFIEALEQLPSFEAPTIKQALISTLAGQSLQLGEIQPVIRLAIMGSATGPDLMKSLEVMGQQEAVVRLKKAISTLGPGRR
jgi:glutamyl-tRNA synthetase